MWVILHDDIDFPVLEPPCGCKCLYCLGLFAKYFDSLHFPVIMTHALPVPGQMNSS